MIILLKPAENVKFGDPLIFKRKLKTVRKGDSKAPFSVSSNGSTMGPLDHRFCGRDSLIFYFVFVLLMVFLYFQKGFLTHLFPNNFFLHSALNFSLKEEDSNPPLKNKLQFLLNLHQIQASFQHSSLFCSKVCGFFHPWVIPPIESKTLSTQSLILSFILS